MPVLPRCPRCQALLAGSGGQERCPRCQEVVVAVLRKLCVRCGRDISNEPRFKEPISGEYYCHPCWLELCESAGKEPAYPCGSCGQFFAGDEVYQEQKQYICKSCHAARSSDGSEAAGILQALGTAEESPTSIPTGYPSPYVHSVRDQRARRKRRDQWIMIGSMVGAAILIVGGTAIYLMLHGT